MSKKLNFTLSKNNTETFVSLPWEIVDIFRTSFEAVVVGLSRTSPLSERHATSPFITIATFYSRKSWQNGLCLWQDNYILYVEAAEAEAAEQNEQMPLLLLFNVLTRHGLTEAEIIERICLHFLSRLPTRVD